MDIVSTFLTAGRLCKSTERHGTARDCTSAGLTKVMAEYRAGSYRESIPGWKRQRRRDAKAMLFQSMQRFYGDLRISAPRPLLVANRAPPRYRKPMFEPASPTAAGA